MAIGQGRIRRVKSGFETELARELRKLIKLVPELNGVESHVVVNLRDKQRLTLTASARRKGHPSVAGKYYDIASGTKSIVFTALFRILEEKSIPLSAPIGHYLEELSGQHTDKITFLHLAAYLMWLNLPSNFGGLSAAEMHAAMMASGLSNPPGKKHRYTNACAYIAGVLVEKLSGKSLDAAISHYVKLPLRVHDIVFNSSGLDLVSTGCEGGLVHDPTARKFANPIGIAGLFSTSRSLAEFFAGVMDPDFLSEEMLNMIFTNHAAISGNNYGLGFDMQGIAWFVDGMKHLVNLFRFLTGHTKNTGMMVREHLSDGGILIPGFGTSLMVSIGDPDVISKRLAHLQTIKDFRRTLIAMILKFLEDAIVDKVLIY